MGEIIEEFRDIPGYEGLYQVSNLGRVKRLVRTTLISQGRLSTRKEKLLSLTDNNRGYLRCSLKGVTVTVHKLVAMVFLDFVPSGYNTVVDHINNIKTDNRLCNLQLVSNRENSSKDRKGGSSKHVGVSWHKVTNSWESRIRIKNKLIHLGNFKDELEAAEMYQKALQNLHLYENCPKKFREKLKNL